jgi:hypothetical protein
MEPLQKLILTIAYPSPIWQSFLESLAAKPSTEDWARWTLLEDYKHEWEQWCSSQTWHANVLPSLKYFGIQSPKGFSPSQYLDNLPLLRLVAWTRAQLSPPLEELKVWEGRGTTDDIVVDYTSTGYLDKHLGTSRGEYDWGLVSGMVTRSLVIRYDNTPLFKQLHSTIPFKQCQALSLWHLPDDTHFLPCLQHTKELKLWNSTIPACSLEIDLPLVYTLRRLDLSCSTFSWMIGRTFTALEDCIIYYPEDKSEDLSRCKGLQVDMPACTRLSCWGSPVVYSLFSCPNVQTLVLVSEGHRVTFEEADTKLLHDFILNCFCLRRLVMFLDHSLLRDSLIEFVFHGGWEQGVWNGIMDVEVNVKFEEVFRGSANERDHFFSQLVGQQQHYEEQWAEFIVTREREYVILKASM